MPKSLNPKLPKVAFQRLITAGSPASSHFGAISTKGLAKDLGLQGGNATVQSKGLKFGSPSSRSSVGSSSQSSSAGTTSTLASSYLSNALGSSLLGSVFTGLSSFFGFGAGSSISSLVRFSLPDTQSIVGSIPAPTGFSGIGGLTSIPGRAVATRNLTAGNVSSMNGVTQSFSASAPATGGNRGSSGGHQFHFHVSAMDAQSFVDRSGDIAKAVKTAMLQSHSLNDVVSET